MNKVTELHHLARRKGVYYYRRRVPAHLVAAIGKSVVQFSLDTKELKQAKQRREVKDIEWSARLSAAESALGGQNAPVLETNPKPTRQLSDRQLAQLVADYVAQKDARFQSLAANDPPASEAEKSEVTQDIEMGLQILANRDDPRAAEIVQGTGQRILMSAGVTEDALGSGAAAFDELVRRALLEIDRRRLARIGDDHSQSVFDKQFERNSRPDVTFSELAAQCLKQAEDEAAANRTSKKWIDKQRATMSLISEIIGVETPIANIDYDHCQHVRTTLAKVPTNRNKSPYRGLPLEKAIALAANLKKPVLSSSTQRHHLTAFKQVLELASSKRLIPSNPARDLGPLKRDDVAAADKRAPFTLEQIGQFFRSEFYQRCAESGQRPYEHDKKGGWRFWLPMICLFSGMRPNEVCQLHVADVKCTKAGIWYFDIATTDDDATGRKTLKTSSSRRQVPIHPELLRIGLLKFVAERKTTKTDPYLFPMKPDVYGNRATYGLKRFRDTFLPDAITMTSAQTFYSFRHSFRDALRRIGAPPDALQALGGWSQGKLVSDSYGEKANADYQAQFINGVAYPGLCLKHLYVPS